MRFNRFDILSAYYWYAMLYHDGLGSRAYEELVRIRRMGFKPSPILSYESLTDNGKAIFDALYNRRIAKPHGLPLSMKG